MADEHLRDTAPDEGGADTQAPGAGGLIDNVKDLANAAGTKLGAVASTVGEVLAPAAQAAGTVASTVGQAARDTAQTVAGTVADAVSSVAANAGAGGDSGPPDHSGGVPETGASVDAGNMQNLPGQGAAGRETM